VVLRVGGDWGVADSSRRRDAAAAEPPPAQLAWLADVATAAAAGAGGVPVQLLGDYLPMLADAAVSGRRPRRAELDAVGRLGRQAAEQGISAGRVVQLYLSSAEATGTAPAGHDNDLGRLMHGELNRLRHGRPWRVAVGRPTPACTASHAPTKRPAKP
jgi:hypothetical protein